MVSDQLHDLADLTLSKEPGVPITGQDPITRTNTHNLQRELRMVTHDKTLTTQGWRGPVTQVFLMLNIIYRLQESIYWGTSKPQGSNQADNVSNCASITPVISPPPIPSPVAMDVTIRTE